MDRHTIRPIVENARFTVRCACGTAMDSLAETAEDAILEVAAKHRCPSVTLRAEAIAASAG